MYKGGQTSLKNKQKCVHRVTYAAADRRVNVSRREWMSDTQITCELCVEHSRFFPALHTYVCNGRIHGNVCGCNLCVYVSVCDCVPPPCALFSDYFSVHSLPYSITVDNLRRKHLPLSHAKRPSFKVISQLEFK
jgi:hypothetical protein